MTLGSPVGIHVYEVMNRRFGVFLWYMLMVDISSCSPPFCAFFPLKEERVQEDPDATVSNGLMVRQLGETKLFWMIFYRKNPNVPYFGRLGPPKMEGHVLKK